MAENISDLDVVSGWRDAEKLKALDYQQLKQEAGSLDAETRQVAQRKLLQFFDLQPERQAEHAKTIDLMEMFNQFSPEQQAALLNNLVAFQLTEGCNGRCPFCLFGSKKGVDAKFSFESLKAFFQANKDKIRSWGSSNITHYWDSDPFDYQDGDKTYADVYAEWRTNFPDRTVYISTTIPKGSIEQFQNFVQQMFDRKKSGQSDPCEIRISVGKQNIQRVEAVFKDLFAKWEAAGIAKSEIASFMEEYFDFSARLENDVSALGPQIKDHDDIHDPSSPACEDGVLLTPDGFEAISMTAATLYQPSGQFNHAIAPTTPLEQIPHFLPKHEYQDINYQNHIADRVKFKQVLFPPVMRHDSLATEVDLPDKVENVTFKLGRWSFSLSGMLDDIGNLEGYKYAIETPQEVKTEFLELCAKQVWNKRWEVWKLVSEAKKLASEQTDDETKTKLEFYALLATVTLKKAEYTARLIKTGAEQSLVVSTVNALNEINKHNVGELSNILENIRLIHDKSGKTTPQQKQIALAQMATLLGLGEDAKPQWLEVIAKTIKPSGEEQPQG